MSSSVKDRQRLLSLDEIPHKRHARCQRSSNESPVKPPIGSPAYATAHQQYAVETAAKLKAEQERRRQHKQVFQCCSHSLSHCYVCPVVCARSGCCDIPFKACLSRACPAQASTEQKRQVSLATEYQSQNIENSKYLRERERVLNLQGTDAGKANQSGDSFDIVTLAYHNSRGGRQLQYMVGGNAVIQQTTLLTALQSQSISSIAALCRMRPSSTRQDCGQSSHSTTNILCSMISSRACPWCQITSHLPSPVKCSTKSTININTCVSLHQHCSHLLCCSQLVETDQQAAMQQLQSTPPACP